MMSKGIAFSIQAWSAWSPSKPEKSQWQQWVRNEFTACEPTLPDVAFVPAMQRRRMSSLSKMVFATASDCIAGLEQQPNCVFASRHGELTRTMKIINAIVSGGDVSPTDFSASVHNTALGLYSIFTKNKNPSSMVVAGEQTFSCALIEASIYLQQFPDTPVLLTYFDEPLPAPLNIFESSERESTCIALLLSPPASEGTAVTMVQNTCKSAQPLESTDLGTEFLRFLLCGQASHTAATADGSWEWSRSV